MKKVNHLCLLTLFFAIIGLLLNTKKVPSIPSTQIPPLISKILPSPTPRITLETPPTQKVLSNEYHIFQTFNNCGPASLSMTLSYYGISETQEALGQKLRPYQVADGDNDDKSVTLAEIAEKSKDYSLIPYHRPNGTVDTLKLFIAYDMPILVRTWTQIDEDIGHFRVIKGYDDIRKIIIQDDSLQGKNLEFSYSEFDLLWEKFNYEFLVLVPSEKAKIAERILKENTDYRTAWKHAVQASQEKLTADPTDLYSRFNLSVAFFNIRDYRGSVTEFEKVENLLPFRTLWYQIEPIEAYFELGNYDRVFQITDKILNNHNRAFSELYILRGKVYQKQGNTAAARVEFEKAVLYNQNLKEAQEALAALN